MIFSEGYIFRLPLYLNSLSHIVDFLMIRPSKNGVRYELIQISGYHCGLCSGRYILEEDVCDESFGVSGDWLISNWYKKLDCYTNTADIYFRHGAYDISPKWILKHEGNLRVDRQE